MKTGALAVVAFFGYLCVTHHALAAAIEWERLYGGPLSIDHGSDVATDGMGHVYLAGDIATSATGQFDAYLNQYDASGNLLWNRTVSSLVFTSVATDPAGNVYAADGTSLHKYDVNGNLLWIKDYLPSGVINVRSDATGNLYLAGFSGFGLTAHSFLMKADSAGDVLWFRDFGVPGQVLNGFSLDGLGNVYVAGQRFTNESSDGFLLKYDSAGNSLWSQDYPDVGNEILSDVSADALGHVYVKGVVAAPFSVPGEHAHDFLASYDPSGNLIWTREIGTADYFGAFLGYGAAAVDGLGNVLTFSHDAQNAYVVKFNSNGDLLWSQDVAGQINGISLDGTSTVYAGGTVFDGYLVKIVGAPEPSTLALGLFGFAALAAVICHRRTAGISWRAPR